jgi:YD repeat-containing protein
MKSRLLILLFCSCAASWQIAAQEKIAPQRVEPKKTTDVSARATVSTYDSAGRLVSTTDATGRINRLGGAETSTIRSLANATTLAPITIQVPGDQPTIQAAINAANNGDTVLVADGTYVENINFTGKAITVTSANGPASTTIDGGGVDSVVTFKTGENANSLLTGFTITNGFSNFSKPNFGDGGGVFIGNASPTVTNNVITTNQGCAGAGISLSFGGPLIQGNTISNNSQAGCSGGTGGGGIGVRGGAPGARIIGNVIANNSMTGSGVGGGGISLFAAGAPLIQDNVFSGNNGGGEGGGISIVNDASPQIVDNLFILNTASSGGGLWWLIPTSTPGILLLNNTIAGNTAAQGSGVFADGFDSNAVFQNNAMIGNSGVNAVFCGNFNNTVPPNFVANDVFADGAAPYGGICTDQTGNNGNISADPLFVDPDVDDYHLQPSSPAIDAGNNAAPIPLPDQDIDGNPRIVNGTVDIGAYEFQGNTTTTFGTTSRIANDTASPKTIAYRLSSYGIAPSGK